MAFPRDLHRLWEDRCAECHGEAGDFARRFLSISDGMVVGQHPDRDLKLFLGNHYLKNNDVDAVYGMLESQTISGARYRDSCAGCHGKAADLVRASIGRRDGVLVRRDPDEPLAEFLPGHAGLSEADAQFYLELLDRIEREIQHP